MQRELSLSQKKRSAHRIVSDDTNCTLLERQRDLCFREQSLAVSIVKSFGTFNTALLQVPICRAWKLNIENMEFQMKFTWKSINGRHTQQPLFDESSEICFLAHVEHLALQHVLKLGRKTRGSFRLITWITHTIYGNVMMNIFGK
jgi:hypothetical protein